MLLCIINSILTFFKRSEIDHILFSGQIDAMPLMNLVVSI